MKKCPVCNKFENSDHTYWWPYLLEKKWVECCQVCWEKESSRAWWEAVNAINKNLPALEGETKAKEEV